MKKFVIALMTLLTFGLGLGGGYLAWSNLESSGNVWLFVIGTMLWSFGISSPLINYWFKYWEEKLK